jgi:short-subunit dehydrogenase
MVIDTPGLEVEQAMLELNTLAVISLTKAVLPHMVKRKTGHIVVTSSVAGKIGKILNVLGTNPFKDLYWSIYAYHS